ncbi:MAG: hypothetical protein HC913_14705 [Microscillaceae bacterium]|nr:hypothetical protein [Microscillaceae bacterium]
MSDIHIVRNHLLTSRHDAKPFGVDWFFKPDGQAKPLVVFVHGFNAFKDWGHFNLVAEAFAQAGFFFVKFNLSHNGTSPEHPTEFVDLEAYGNDKFSTDLDDIGLVLDFILDHHLSMRQNAMLPNYAWWAIAGVVPWPS